MLHSALKLCAVLTLVPPSTAEVEGARYRELSASAPEASLGAWAGDRQLHLEVLPDGLHVQGTWIIRSHKKALFDGPVLPAGAHINSLRWNGRKAATYLTNDDASMLHVVGLVDGEARLELDAMLSLEVSSPFALLPATTGAALVTGGDELRLVAVDGAAGPSRAVGGAQQLQLIRNAAPTNSATLATGALATGVTFSDATANIQARARWNLRRGALSEVALNATQLGADLQVEGPNVARWTRDGDRIRVELRESAKDSVVVELSWTLPLAGGSDASFTMPVVDLEQAFGVERTLQLARDGELDILPALQGWNAVSHRSLRGADAGLIEGVVTASFRGAQDAAGGEVTLLRFEPVPGPAATIDVAALDVALSAEGNAMHVARYEVQNERASHLGVRLPAGATVLGIKVAGQVVAPVRDGDQLRIPLPRSVETLRGLLSVPVVVAYTRRGSTWKRRHDGTLALPIIDLPIQTQQISVRLPRRYSSRLEPGVGGVVEAFDQGLHVAHGLADPDAVANADATLGRAAKAWNANDFELAQQEINNFRGIGAEGFSQGQLQSNVDLVVTESAAISVPTSDSTDSVSLSSVPGVSAKSVGLARRIKGRVRSRSMDKRVQQRKRKKKARELKNEGRYDEAAAEYKKALEDSKDLRKLDEDESQTYAAEEEEILLELDDVEVEKSNRKRLESSEVRKFWSETIDFVPLPEVKPPPPRASALVVLPRAGQIVRYQLTLLPAGAQRSVRYRVRRRLRRHRL